MTGDIDLIPFTDFGGEGSIIHFSHANGFPPASYTQLIELLRPNHQIIASHHRPLWKPTPQLTEVANWQVFADDLISFLDANASEPVYGAGHSMGGVASLVAAIQRPDLFKAIILIEPVIMPAYLIIPFGLFPAFIKNRIPIMKKALNRPDIWESQQEAFDFHRTKRVFQKLTDKALWDYITCATEVNANKEYTLTYSKEWGARCYSLVPDLWSILDKCSVPVLGIKAEHSDVLLPSAWKRWKRSAPACQFEEIPETSHLLPLENPKAVADLILKFTSG
ncbi:MAG: alpha/beta hydrolase [Flavobacteriales bacterium]|nr:alpha/beta hydrolase [Flavobacteriales bacterium]